MSKLVYLRGLSTDLDSNSLKDGQILFTEDTNELFIDFLNPTTQELDRKPIQDKQVASKLQQFIDSLNKVENKSSEEIRDEITYDNIIDALGFIPSAGSGSSFDAENITYDNTESGLKGQDVQSALDELVEKNAVNQTGIIALQAEIEDKVSKDYVDKSINDLVDSAPDTMNTLKELATEIQNNQSVINTLDSAITNKVDKIDGKGLSTNDYTTEEKNKLATVSSGAEANVQSDWNITNDKDDAFIKNKPFIPTKTSDLTNDSGFKTTDNDTWKANTASSEGYVAKGEGQINKVWKTDSNGVPGWRNDNNTTYDVATTSSNGLMSSVDKSKLNSITEGAEPNVQSDWNIIDTTNDGYIKNKPTIPTKTSQLTNDSGFKTTDTDTWKPNSSTSEGYVASGSGQVNKVWKTDADGVPAWRDDANTTYSNATQSSAGLLSASDKKKLDNIANGAEVNVQSDWNITDTGSDSYIKNKPTIPSKTSQLTNDSGFKTTDTWKANTATSEGYVAKGEGNANKVWKTNADGVPGWRDDANTTYTLGSFGITATKDELNYTDGVTSNIQTQLNAKVPTSRTVNNKALSSNITLGAADVGADPSGSAATALKNAKTYVDGKIDAIVGEGASETLDTIGEISKAIEDHRDVTDALNAAIGNKVDKVSGKGLSTNDYTTKEKNKLSGIASGAEVNQNAFSNVIVGSTTISADSKTDSLTLAGSNVTITPDATNDKVTIGITKANVTAALGYTPPTTDTNTWKPNSASSEGYVASGSGQANKVWKTDGNGVPGWRDDANTTYSAATQSANGLMSSTDKKKLDGIASGAEVNVQSDWSVTDTGSDAFIKNKPTIPTKTSQLTNDSSYTTGTDVDNKLKTLKPENIADGYTTKGFYINTHPENSPTVIPFINNDIAFLLKRGGSAVVKYDGTTQNVDISNVFDGSPSYWAINPTNVTEIVIELTLHKVFAWTNTVYVDMGSNGWRAKNVKLEVINTNYANDTWTVLNSSTNRTISQYKHTFSYTPTGAENAGGGFNKIRLTFSSWATSTIFRIAAIGIINYGSNGLRETFVPKDGGEMYGGITPYANNSYNIGSSSKKYANVYATKFVGDASTVNGHTVETNVPSGAKFTDTTYSNFVKSGSGAKAGLVPAPSTTAGTTKYLREDGTWQVPPDNNTTYSNMTAATSSAAGKAGLVPAPAAGAQAKFLRGDGTWQTPTNTTYGIVSASANGLVPMFDAADGTIDSSSSDWVLTNNNGSIGWYKLPANAFNNTTYSAATTSANGLMSKDDKTKLDNTNEAYGTCSTAAATAAKVVTISGNTKWALKAGSRITIKFSATNTAKNPTLNVNNTGAKSIWYNTGLITTGSLGMAGTANRPMDFVYDGTQYVFMGWSLDNNTTYSPQSLGNGYGTCSTAAATAAKVVTLSGYNLTTNGFVAVKFTNAVPANATMNINSKGAKSIYYKGAAITANVIKAGDLATFVYNGSQYHLISLDSRKPYVSGTKLIM